MAGQASSYGSGVMLDAASGRATQNLGTRYIALCSALPTDASTGATITEVTGPGTNGYARQTIVWTDPAATESTENTALITFGAATAAWGTATYAVLMDSLTGVTSGDEIYWWWTLDAAKTAANGDSITIAASAFTMTAE